MGTKQKKWFRAVLPIVAALVFVLGSSRRADAEFSCFQDLKSCYLRVAVYKSIWDMWLGGLDCELTWFDCGRRAIIGR